MERGEATLQETVLAAECRVTYVQGPNDFEPKRARENKEGKREEGLRWRKRDGKRKGLLSELKRNSSNWLAKIWWVPV